MDRTINTSLNEKVDHYLHKISLSPTLTMNPRDLYEVDVLDEETYLIDQEMLERGLIKIEGESRVITGKGLEISNFGGWKNYQNLFRKERTLLKERDKIGQRYEFELDTLRKTLTNLEHEIETMRSKDAEENELIAVMRKQYETSRLIYLVSGVAIGFSVAAILWLVFGF